MLLLKMARAVPTMMPKKIPPAYFTSRRWLELNLPPVAQWGFLDER